MWDQCSSRIKGRIKDRVKCRIKCSIEGRIKGRVKGRIKGHNHKIWLPQAPYAGLKFNGETYLMSLPSSR